MAVRNSPLATSDPAALAREKAAEEKRQRKEDAEGGGEEKRQGGGETGRKSYRKSKSPTRSKPKEKEGGGGGGFFGSLGRSFSIFGGGAPAAPSPEEMQELAARRMSHGVRRRLSVDERPAALMSVQEIHAGAPAPAANLAPDVAAAEVAAAAALPAPPITLRVRREYVPGGKSYEELIVTIDARATTAELQKAVSEARKALPGVQALGAPPKPSALRLEVDGKLLEGAKTLEAQGVKHRATVALSFPPPPKREGAEESRQRVVQPVGMAKAEGASRVPATDDAVITLKVTTLEGEWFTIDAFAGEQVKGLKKRIAQAGNSHGMEYSEFVLTFQGVDLPPEATLREAEIGDHFVLLLHPKTKSPPRGGGGSPPRYSPARFPTQKPAAIIAWIRRTTALALLYPKGPRTET